MREIINNGSEPLAIVDRINIVDENVSDCPFCKTVLKSHVVKMPVDNPLTVFKEYRKTTVKFCPKCHKSFLSKYEAKYLKRSKNNYIFSTVSINEKKNKSYDCKNIKMLKDDEISYIIVFGSCCQCISCKNRYGFDCMEDYTLVVENYEGKEVEVPVFRCKYCGRYYINEEILKSYLKRYGPLLFERRSEKSVFGSGFECKNREYAEDTILSRCGYSAQIDNNFERWSILSFIIETGLSSKSEVMQILSYFIRTRGDKCYKAHPKWEKDLKYVGDLHIEEHPRIYKFKFVKKEKAEHKINIYKNFYPLKYSC